MTDAEHWPLMLGTAVYAYEGTGMILPVIHSLSPAAKARFPMLLTRSMMGISLLYIAIGFIPYAYYQGHLGVAVEDTITLNLPANVLSYVVKAGYCLALLFSYPVMMFPAMTILENAAMPYL